MNPEKDKNFEQNIQQLIGLIKKILKGLPLTQGQIPGLVSQDKESGVNLNLCFFTFLPIPAEEIEEWDEIYDHLIMSDDKPEDLTMDLNSSDVEFLRRNGIRF